MYICWPSPSNQGFFRQIADYQRSVGDQWFGGGGAGGPWANKSSYKTLVGVHLTMHPN